MAQFLEVDWDDNTKFYFQMKEASVPDVQRRGRSVESTFRASKKCLEESFQQIGAFTSSIIQNVRKSGIIPDEIEVEFAVSFSSDLGIVFSSVGTETGIILRAKWNNSK